MIRIQNVTKMFGDYAAVNDLSLEIKDGEIFGLLGPNGAGKSTTLKMMTGILQPTKGDIFIDDYSILKNPVEAKSHIGFVPDSPDMFLGMRGRDYLAFIASVYRMEPVSAEKKAIDLAKQMEIYDALDQYIANYSHGMRQKIFIIGALLHSPSDWILDEPLTGLDPQAAFVIKEMMKKHAGEKKTVLFSTHVLDVAEKVCDRVGIIAKGKLLFVGTLQELKDKEQEKNGSLESLFLELVK
jgi:ABC-2 type transport system ATP-binding protein